MKRIILSSFLLLHLTMYGSELRRLEAAENPAENMNLAQAPMYKSGDSWIYRAVDKVYGGATTSNLLNGVFDITVQDRGLQVLRQNGTAWLQATNFEPLTEAVPVTEIMRNEEQFFQFPLTVGKKWETKFYSKELGDWVSAENSVAGIDTVTTRAGSFPAFRIERRISHLLVDSRISDHNKYYLTYVYFYSPRTRTVVKYHYQLEHQINMGDLSLERTLDIELVKFGSGSDSVTVTGPAAAAKQNAPVSEVVGVNEMKEEVGFLKADASPVAGAPLTLRMNIIGQRRETDGSYTEIMVREGSLLRAHDNFQVHFETTSPAFIYILLYDSQGKASQLFPDPKIDQPNFVEGGRSIVIPERNSWFWLDESAGTETVYVIASKKAMSDIRGLLAKMESADDAGQKNASQQIRQSIAIMQRGVGGVTKGQTVTYTLSDGKKIQNVTDVVEGTGSVVRAVSFQHK